MEVLNEKPKKVFVVPSPGVESREGTVTKKEYRTEKLCFLAGMPVLLKIQDLLLRSDEPDTACSTGGQCFKVRSPVGWISAHCAACWRAGFVTEVPA